MSEGAEIYLCSARETLALGRRLGRFGRSGGTVFLRGGLGAGKTTFSRGVLSALGHRGPVRSPTYTLFERYHLAGLSVSHLDCYRLRDALELEMLDLGAALVGRRLWLVEWPERMAAALPPPDLALDFVACGAGRLARWQPLSECGRQLARGLF